MFQMKKHVLLKTNGNTMSDVNLLLRIRKKISHAIVIVRTKEKASILNIALIKAGNRIVIY